MNTPGSVLARGFLEKMHRLNSKSPAKAAHYLRNLPNRMTAVTEVQNKYMDKAVKKLDPKIINKAFPSHNFAGEAPTQEYYKHFA